MRLRVATFNTWAGPPVPWLWPSHRRRTAVLCENLADVAAQSDVVMLQEVCAPELQQALTHRFGHDFHVFHSPQRHLWPLVLCVLLPLWALVPRLAVAWLLLCWLLRNEACVQWWRCAGLSMLVRRTMFVGLYATHINPPAIAQSWWNRLCCRPRLRQVVRTWLTVRRESVDLHNVHLDAPFAQAQFEDILHRPVGSNLSLQHSDVVVVGGDFNRQIRGAQELATWCPSSNALVPPQWWLPERDRRGPDVALDHILARSTHPALTEVTLGESKLILQKAGLSDHYGLYSEFSIITPQESPQAPVASRLPPPQQQQKQQLGPSAVPPLALSSVDASPAK
jgi:endonuclease/exonuclease/phosphatase family metal-dependent hydrolase